MQFPTTKYTWGEGSNEQIQVVQTHFYNDFMISSFSFSKLGMEKHDFGKLKIKAIDGVKKKQQQQQLMQTLIAHSPCGQL